MDMDEYKAIDALNWSKLKHIATSPMHMQHRASAEHTDSVSMRIGRAIHTAVLEPDAFSTRHPVYEGTRRGKAWDAFQDEHPGADILTGTEAEKAHAAANAVLRHPVATRYLTGGVAERVLQFTYPGTNIKCKARLDLVGRRIVELKSVNPNDFAPGKFSTHVARMQYHGQIAWYQTALEQAGEAAKLDPVIIAVETEPPHDVAVYVCGDEVVSAGDALVDHLVQRYLKCVESGQWPGVCPDSPLELRLPAWAVADAETDDKPLTIGGVALEV